MCYREGTAATFGSFFLGGGKGSVFGNVSSLVSVVVISSLLV